MSFPVGDWQFWAVTASMLGSVWMLVRPFVGERKPRAARGGCADCAAAAAPRCPSGTRAGSERLVLLGKPGGRSGGAG